jgi:hypothetical protein
MNWVNGRKVPCSLNLGTRSSSRPGRFTSRGKNPRYPLGRRFGGLQGRSRHGGEEKKKALPLPEIKPRSSNSYPSHYIDRTTVVPLSKVKVKLSLCLTKHHPFFDIGSLWRYVVRFTPRLLYPQGKYPGTHCIGGWVGPRDSLDMVWKRKIPSPPPPRIEPRSSNS